MCACVYTYIPTYAILCDAQDLGIPWLPQSQITPTNGQFPTQ